MTDINEHAKARERFFDLSVDLLAVVGLDGYARELSHSWATLGWSPAELHARPIREFIHPDDLSSTLAKRDELLAGAERLNIENRYMCKDGSERWLSWSSTYSASDEAYYLIGHDITGRRRSQVFADVHQRVTQILWQEADEISSLEHLLACVATSLGWEVALYWLVSDKENLLRCSNFWTAPNIDIPAFAADSETATFQPSEGIAGTVWQTGLPIWIPNVQRDSRFKRAQVAAKCGLHTLVCIPLGPPGHVRGSIEFFHRDIVAEHPEMLAHLTTLGQQIGQHVEDLQAAQRQQEAHAIEINEEVIHNLSSATLALSLGNHVAAAEAIEKAGEAASRIVAGIVTQLGRTPVPEQVDDGVPNLTSREMEIVALVARGHTNAHVGSVLGISSETVKVHVTNARRKLQLPTRSALVVEAFRRGIA